MEKILEPLFQYGALGSFLILCIYSLYQLFLELKDARKSEANNLKDQLKKCEEKKEEHLNELEDIVRSGISTQKDLEKSLGELCKTLEKLERIIQKCALVNDYRE